MTIKKGKFGIKKLIATLLLVSLVSVSPLSALQAHAWDAIPGAIVKQALEEMSRQILAMIRSLMKTMAATMINVMVSRIVSGGSGGPGFITNWESYIIGKSRAASAGYVNSYIDQAFAGAGSSASYRANPNFEGVGYGVWNAGSLTSSNYAQRIQQQLSDDVMKRYRAKADYNGNPSQMMKSGTFKDTSRALSPQNNAWGQYAAAEEVRMESLEEERDVYMAKAIAGGGFIGTEKDGNTITPGSIMQAAMANAQNIGNNIVATAKDFPEVLTGLATKLVTQVITQGIGNIQAKLQKEVLDVQFKQNQAQGAQNPSSRYNR